MNEEYALFALVNVFDVTPSFLLPIFINDGKFYFQEINDDKIVSFEEAEVNELFKCKLFIIKESMNYREGSRAVYAINSANERFFYGSIDMVDKTATLLKIGFNDHFFYSSLKQFHNISYNTSLTSSYLITSTPSQTELRSDLKYTTQYSVLATGMSLHMGKYINNLLNANEKTNIIEENDNTAWCFKLQNSDGISTVNSIFELLKWHERPMEHLPMVYKYYVKTSKDILKLSEQFYLLNTLLDVDDWRYGFEKFPCPLYDEVELSTLLWEKFYNYALDSYKSKVLMQLNAWGMPVFNTNNSEFLAHGLDTMDWINHCLEESNDERTLLTIVIKKISSDIRAFVVREHLNNDYRTLSHVQCQCSKIPYNSHNVIMLLVSIIKLYQENLNIIFISSCDELGDEFSEKLSNLQNKYSDKCKIWSMPGRVFVNPEDS